ncbi:MAG TPA: metallophosphoesterase [Chthoniobacterales bacterium]|nr:metallophosphoesterase [Chthoniobacterales bacterium]
MKILLTADLHDRRTWLEWLLKEAHNYELVCIAGDLLDMFAADEGGQIDHLRGDWLPKMIATGVPLAVCSGNHDHGMITWLNHIDVPGKVVGDGSTQLLSFSSGEQLIVTTCPYYRSFNRRDSTMIELWDQGARLRDEWFAPWLVLHHEPPAQFAPKPFTATHWLTHRLQTYRPSFVYSGHIHVWHEILCGSGMGRLVFQCGAAPRRPETQLPHPRYRSEHHNAFECCRFKAALVGSKNASSTSWSNLYGLHHDAGGIRMDS